MQKINIKKIQSVTQLYDVTPNKTQQRYETNMRPFDRRNHLIQSTATQLQIGCNRGKMIKNNSPEKYYQKNFQLYKSENQLEGNNNDKERLFHAKLKILAVMKKLNIYIDRLNFAQISIQEAIQQLYLLTKDHMRHLEQKIQVLMLEKENFNVIGSKQKIKELHVQQQMAKVSYQLQELDQIKQLKNLNMQYLEQIKHLMEDLDAKQVQVENLKEQLIQKDTMIRAQQDGVDKLINGEYEMANSLNDKIERLRTQRANLRKQLYEARMDTDRLKRQINSFEKNNQILKISLQNQRNELELANQAQEELKAKFKFKQQDFEKQIKLLNEKAKVENQLCDKKQNTIQTLKKQIKQWMNFEKERDVKHNQQIQTIKTSSARQIDKLTQEIKRHEQSIYDKQKIIYDLQQIKQQLIKKGEQSQRKQQILIRQIKDINEKYKDQVNELLNDLNMQKNFNKQNCEQIKNQSYKIQTLNTRIEQLYEELNFREAQSNQKIKSQKQFFEKQISAVQKRLEEQTNYFENQMSKMKQDYEILKQNRWELENKLSFQIQEQTSQIQGLNDHICQLKGQQQRKVDQLNGQVTSLQQIKSKHQRTIRDNQEEIKRLTIELLHQVQAKKSLTIEKQQENRNWKFRYQSLVSEAQQKIRSWQLQYQKLDGQSKSDKQHLQHNIISLQKQVKNLNIMLQQSKQELISQLQDYQSKQKRFSQTLEILRKRNNELNIKYQQEIKKRDNLEGRYYELEKENNEKIDKLTNQLSQVTIMVQKQHVPRGNFSKLQQFETKIMTLQIKMSEAQTQSNQLRDLLEQKEKKIEQLEAWTKSSKIFSEK